MRQTFTIPEQELDFVTQQLQINLDNKTATVTVWNVPSGSSEPPSSTQKVIDVVTSFSGSMSGPEVTAFKKGIKLIVADAWNKAYEDLDGDPF